MQLYTAAQTRELDRIAIEEFSIPGIRLMGRAGKAALELLLEIWPEPACVHIFCGTGNNGGDGFVVAELAVDRNLQAHVYQVGDASKISGDALAARRRAEAAGVRITDWEAGLPMPDGVIVDALLGTGLNGPVRPEYVPVIEAINAAALPVMALDIPSGLCSDGGAVLGSAVRADQTISFIGLKQGLVTGAAAVHCGGIHFTDLAVPMEVYNRVESGARLLNFDEELAALPERPRDAHKGRYGHVLVLGGDTGMGGAALMAAEAAARCGAGLVSAATRPEHVPAFIARRPEIMCLGVDHTQQALGLIEKATVVVVGPGLGQSPWGEQLFYLALGSGKPLVVDADALNLLARGEIESVTSRDDWVLTPHPGEAARMLEVPTAEIQSDRFGAAQALQERYGGTILLKGSGSLVAGAEDCICVAPYGNPGMASGGMGDVLSGVIAGLATQDIDLHQAAVLGACLHGRAADIAAESGERGLLAADLMAPLQELLC